MCSFIQRGRTGHVWLDFEPKVEQTRVIICHFSGRKNNKTSNNGKLTIENLIRGNCLIYKTLTEAWNTVQTPAPLKNCASCNQSICNPSVLSRHINVNHRRDVGFCMGCVFFVKRFNEDLLIK